MSMFQQYQSGIQPVTGVSEAGANIGNMYRSAVSNFGENLAKGIENYHKNKALNDSADEKLAVMADEFAQRIHMFSSTPEFADFAKVYEPLQSKVEKAHTLNLPQKLSLINEVDSLNSRTDKEFALYSLIKQSREAQVIPDAIDAAKAGTARITPLVSNPNDVKWNARLTYDQNEQEARRYYRDIKAKSPNMALKSEDDWIAQWRSALPRVIQSDPNLHPIIKAKALEQIDNAQMDVDYGSSESNLHYYLSRYADIPFNTETATPPPAPVTTATPSGTLNGVPVNSSGTPLPSYSPAPLPVAKPVATAMPVLPRTNPMGTPSSSTVNIAPQTLPPPPSASASQPLPPAAPVVVPQPSVTTAASPVIIPKTEPVQQTQTAPTTPVSIPAPSRASAVTAPTAPAGLPAPESTATKPSSKKKEPKSEGYYRKQEQIQRLEKAVANAETEWSWRRINPDDYRPDKYAKTNAEVRDDLESLKAELEATKNQPDEYFTTATEGDIGMQGEEGQTGQPEESSIGTPATTQRQLDMGREIFAKDESKLIGEYQGARAAREYLQTLQNNVENGTGIGLPTSTFNQVVKENPDLWRSLGWASKLGLDTYAAVSGIQGIENFMQSTKYGDASGVASGEFKKLLADEMNRIAQSEYGIDEMKKLSMASNQTKEIFQKATKNLSGKIDFKFNKTLEGLQNLKGASVSLLLSQLFNDNKFPEGDKFDLPSEIQKGSSAWTSPIGGQFVSKTLDEIRAISTDAQDSTPEQKARINQLLLRKINEAKQNEKNAHDAWNSHRIKASPEAFSASYAGAAIPDAKQRASYVASSIPRINLPSLAGDNEGIVSMPSMTIGTKTIIQQPSLDEKRAQMKEFFKSRLGYVPSSFESIVKNAFPEASLSFQETPYGVMMHDGKEWKPLSSGKTLQPHEISANRAVTFGTMLADGSFKGEELMPNSGIRISGIGAFGTPSDATKFRQEYPRLIRAKNALVKLQKINDKFGKSIDLTLRGQAAILTKEIIAQLRTEIVGVGTVSNFEQGILQDIIQNPADIFHWTATTGAKYAQLLEQVNEALHTMPAQHGLTVEIPDDKEKELEAARTYWRQANKK